MTPEVFVSTASACRPRDLPAVLERFLAAGIRAIELSAPHPHLPTSEIDALLADARAQGAKFILHNYFPSPAEAIVLNLAAADEYDHAATLALTTEALGIAERAEASLYACHAGYRAHASCPPDGYFQFKTLDNELDRLSASRQRDSIATILGHPAVTRGRVRFGIENLFPCYADGVNVSYCCTPDEIGAILDAFRPQRLGLLLDLGHLMITATLLDLDRDALLDELIERFGDRIYEIHLSGNDARRDLHRPLEPSDWQLAVLPRLRDLPGTGDGLYFTLEARGLDEEACLNQVALIERALTGGDHA